MRFLWLFLLASGACTLLIIKAGPEVCEEGGPPRCEEGALLLCEDGVTLREECGILACNIAEARCGECGDGLRDATFEECDDGNTLDGDTCESDCTVAFCGNGIVDVGEVCDDGNDISGDGCEPGCAPPDCGDGELNPGEECDDGNLIETDGCRSACLLARCGDGVIQSGVEGCEPPGAGSCNAFCLLGCDDPGDCADSDACTVNESCEASVCVVDLAPIEDDLNSCTFDSCDPNSGTVHTPAPDGFVCDTDQNLNTRELCLSESCLFSRCGDGFVDAGGGEGCDDGNTLAGDGCSADCSKLEVCGDGTIDAGEECDDGNLISLDGCDGQCLLESCGNGILDSGEGCDNGPGNSNNQPDACRLNCQPARCGDITLDSGEECDDGNTQNGDGCSSACRAQVPGCGDGIVQAGEQCDDANTTNNDGCSSSCQNEADVFVLCDGGAEGDGSLVNPFRSLQAMLNSANTQSGDVVMILPQSTLPCTGVTVTKPITLQGLSSPGIGAPTPPAIEGTLELNLNAVAQVFLRDLILHSTSGSAVIVANKSKASLTRVDVRADASNAPAISCTGNNPNLTLLVDRAVVHDSPGGGVLVGQKCMALLSNSLFLNNGSNNASVGAVAVEGSSAKLHLVFSTLSGNESSGPSVECQSNNTGRIEGSIIDDGANPVSASCAVLHTDVVGATPPPGQGNISADPLFTNETAGGFSLEANSPCIDAAVLPVLGFAFDPLVVFGQDILLQDLRGAARVSGAAPDMGAVENQ